ncbi:hypothetical protein BDV95DRAFT_613082 [Massariosphaeria phaeospora]|uniref:Uncharacterized protein n=1 Tax=Massariosphaeria phaeospora TaxID=100035 RepID=A0A7C8M3U3_9PLEO|nr:hypothetical protein BDV95DRAFT_613082 [Massariosphaeria phaeospora]
MHAFAILSALLLSAFAAAGPISVVGRDTQCSSSPPTDCAYDTFGDGVGFPGREPAWYYCCK